MAKCFISLMAAATAFLMGLFIGGRVSIPDKHMEQDLVLTSTSRKELEGLGGVYEVPVFDASDTLTEALLLEEIDLLEEDIADLESYIAELSPADGLVSDVINKAKAPALSENGYLGDALIDELELSGDQISRVNTVLHWGKEELNTLSQSREQIIQPKKNLYVIQNREFRKDGKDVKRSMYEALSEEMGESKTQTLFKKANKDFKSSFHNFGQSAHKTTIKLSPNGAKKKGIYIKDEHTEFLSGNRTVQKVDSGYYNTIPKRFESMLDVEFKR